MCPTIMVSTMPIDIQPSSARMSGRARVRTGRICWRIDMAGCTPPLCLVLKYWYQTVYFGIVVQSIDFRYFTAKYSIVNKIAPVVGRGFFDL